MTLKTTKNDDWLNRLIRDLQAGIDEERNFRRLFDRFHPAVLQFFRIRGIPEEDCHDLTGETFVGAYEGLRNFRGEARFETWLFRIAGNLHYNYQRSRKTKNRDDHGRGVSLTELEESGRTIPDGEASESPSNSGKPLYDVIENERLQMLQAAVAKLPERMRRCVVLGLRGRSIREIAKLLEISPETVKARQHQARQRLKPMLADYFEALSPEDDEEYGTVSSKDSLLQAAGGGGRGGGSSGKPPGRPQPQRRFLQGRFPTCVHLGDGHALQTRIALEAGTDSSATLKDMAIPPEGLEVLLVLHSPGFEQQSGNQHRLRVPPNDNSDWTVFELKSVHSGVHTLDISAYAGGRYLGSLAIETTVDNAVATGHSRHHTAPLRERPGEEGDFTLEVAFDEKRQIYTFRLIDYHLRAVSRITPQFALTS